MVFNLHFGVGEAADDREELESVRLDHQLSLLASKGHCPTPRNPCAPSPRLVSCLNDLL